MKHILNEMSEEEKNLIRQQHTGGMKVNTERFNKLLESKSGDVKPLINEQAWLKNLFGTSVDDLVRLYGDDAVKSFETVLSKALQNSKNFVAKSGKNYLKSASGTEISMETIEKATKLVSSGTKTADEVAALLPRQLADGSEFRSVFQKSFSKKPVAPTKPTPDMSNAKRQWHGGYAGSN
jgi:hypothetical protein